MDAVIRQAERAEADGFTTLWFNSPALSDPLVAMAIAGRATSTIELGTSVLQTYTCHPVLQANRVAAAATAMGDTTRFTLGVGPAHASSMQLLGEPYTTPGRHTEEYVRILAALLSGQSVDVSGEEFQVCAAPPDVLAGRTVSVLVSALAPRLLRVAGEHAAGTIPWLANARALEEHVTPRVTAAATAAGRPAPRIVAGLPVAVHDDVAEARSVAAKQFAMYATLPNYMRILECGGLAAPADAAIVGNEASVTAQIEALFAAGATDVWAAPFPVGDDASASRTRTRDLLASIAKS